MGSRWVVAPLSCEEAEALHSARWGRGANAGHLGLYNVLWVGLGPQHLPGVGEQPAAERSTQQSGTRIERREIWFFGEGGTKGRKNSRFSAGAHGLLQGLGRENGRAHLPSS